MNAAPVIAIDGPSGTGKGTASCLLASRLQWWYLDSGAVYRVFAWQAAEHRLTRNDLDDLVRLAGRLPSIEIQYHAEGRSIWFQNQDVTALISTNDCAQLASQLSVHPDIRRNLQQIQRDFRRLPGLVADGRDMGTVIFPDASLKIYLDAHPEVRAQRRHHQLKQQGIDVTLNHLLTEINQRDQRDKERAYAPLRPAENAIVIDCSAMTVAQVVDEIEQHHRQTANQSGT